MIKTLALLATLGGGALSICNLCDTGTAATSPVTRAHTPAVSRMPAALRPAAAVATIPPGAVVKTVTFKVTGMTCGGCVIGVRTVLTRLPGVTKADVSYEHQSATVTYDASKVTPEQMIAAIKTVGYTATVVTT